MNYKVFLSHIRFFQKHAQFWVLSVRIPREVASRRCTEGTMEVGPNNTFCLKGLDPFDDNGPPSSMVVECLPAQLYV